MLKAWDKSSVLFPFTVSLINIIGFLHPRGHVMKISPVNYYPIGRTQFYPGYNEHRDRVDAVIPIKPISFQKVLRYDLNTGDTRSSVLAQKRL